MTLKLKPYSEYKDSGVPWFGDIPRHWDVLRSKLVFREVDLRSTTGKELHLSMSQKHGLIPSSQVGERRLMSESQVGGKLCEPGDVVLNRLKAHLGVFAIAKQAGIVSPDYTVFRPRARVSPKYYELVLRTPLCRSELRMRAKGIVEGFWRLYTDDFYEIKLPWPPHEEQAKIILCCSAINGRINRFIRAKRRLIELLTERREAVTLSALQLGSTRSLRLDAVVERIERQINRRDEEVYTPIGLYNRGRGIFHKGPTKGSALGDSTFFWIEEGDLVLSGQFAWEGAVAIAAQEDTGCVASHRYPILRGRRGLAESAYLLSFFRTGIGHLLLDQHSRGAAGRNRPLNARTLIKEKIPIPPLNVQQEIAELVHLERKLSHAVARQVELLSEYRTRLIADVVTGRLDVRGLELSALDEIETLEDLESLDETETEQVDDIEEAADDDD